MAFKEVRRRSDLFRPWDSSLNSPLNCGIVSNSCESSSPTLTNSSTKSETNDKSNVCKTGLRKSSDNINYSQKRVSSLSCDKTANSISCAPLPSMPNQWLPTPHQNPTHIPMIPKQNYMLCPPHSALPFADHMFYDSFHQPFMNPTPYCDQSLVDTSNMNRQWRQLQQQKKQRPKRFQCPHCRVSFSNNGQLKGHIRIHTGIQLLFQFIFFI